MFIIVHKISVIHGPNLNLLGRREPHLYGQKTLEEINHHLISLATSQSCELDCFQSNHEGVLIDHIQAFEQRGISIALINPAGLTHSSVALRDALLAVQVPFIEVHLSNVYARESFRHYSYFSDVAIGTISGFGAKGYELAFLAAMNYLTREG